MNRWKLSPKEAAKLQLKLKGRVIYQNRFGSIKTIAGVDISFSQKSDIGYAGIVILTFPEMKLIERKLARGKIYFPYIPGLLAFREGPLIEKLFQRIQHQPDITMFDGHGRAHPKQFGIASHMGVLLNIPTIGCAKSKLTGKYQMPADEKGAATDLTDKNGETIGKVLRSREGCKPVFISIGHKINLETALTITIQTCTKYRIPEPTRQAHIFVNEERRSSVI